MKKLLIIAMLLFTTSAFASTAWWDHDCVNTTGFRLYYNTTVMGTVLCPDKSLTIPDLPDGVYTVTAYNDLESEHSEPFLLTAYYYNNVKLEYDMDGRLAYKGEHTDVNALDTDLNWVITKYYFIDSRSVGRRIRTTSWTLRAVGW